MVIYSDYDIYEIRGIYTSRKEAEKHLEVEKKSPWGSIACIDEHFLFETYEENNN